MKKKLLSTVLLMAAGAAFAPGCGQIEIGTVHAGGQSESADAGAAAGSPDGGSSTVLPPAGGAPGAGGAGAPGVGGAGAPGAAGESSVGVAGQDSEATCALPPVNSWRGCFGGQPCQVCSTLIADYPLYLARHPDCQSYYACDHGVQNTCSSSCPRPSGADQCDGTVGNWKGCRGLGCYVCTELVADYPHYFMNHPFCISNNTCEGTYFTCSAACPSPEENDR